MRDIGILKAAELYTNPYNLTVSIEEDKKSRQHTIRVLCGPVHDQEPMLTIEPFSRAKNVTIAYLESILLDDVIALAQNESGSETNMMPDLVEDTIECLTPDVVAWIAERLHKTGRAETKEMVAAV